MSEPFGRLRRFLRELKRRKVYRAAAGYLVAAFVVLQLAGLAANAFGFPGWFEPMIWVVAGLGFPLVLVLAWAFEMTPEGMRRTPETETEEAPEEPQEQRGTRRAVQLLAALGLIAVAGAGIWQFTSLGEGDGATAAATPRIVVLPFDNIGRDTGDAGFARGMYEEVLNQLSKVSGLAVLSRTTGMELADSEMTAAEIGREHDVQAILEGSVDRAGDRLRIRTQLIEAPEDEQVWSNTYERQLSVEQIFDIQADIAEQITSALETELTASERTRIAAPPTEDLGAYDAYVKGREYIWEGLSGGANVFKLDTAVVNLRQAIERDSTFAAAHGLLGFIYGFRFDFTRAPRLADSARTYIARADSLQPGLVQTHLARGVISSSTGDYDRSLKELRAVLNEQPDHGFAMMTMSEVYGARGEQAQALRWALRAPRQDPRNVAYIFDVMGLLRRLQFYDAAMAWYKRGISHHPQNSLLYLERSRIEADQGRYEEAYQIAQQALEWHPEVIRLQRDAGVAKLQLSQLTQAREHLERVRDLIERRQQRSLGFPQLPATALGYTYLQIGEEERGRRLLKDAARWAQTQVNAQPSGEAWTYSAAVHSALGEPSAARDDLQRAVDAGWVEVADLRIPLFDPVRNEPWFQQMKRQVESNLEAQREQVLQMNFDLYPPGAGPDTAVTPDD